MRFDFSAFHIPTSPFSHSAFPIPNSKQRCPLTGRRQCLPSYDVLANRAMIGNCGPHFPENPFCLEFAQENIKSIQSGGYLWLPSKRI
jgi:hypothetical protein